MRQYGKWVDRVFQLLRYQDGLAIGDWNAHHEEWSLIRKGNKRGRLLHEAAEEVGASWIRPDGPTWERKVGGKVKQSRIDLVFAKGVEVIGKIGKAKLASDH